MPQIQLGQGKVTRVDVSVSTVAIQGNVVLVPGQGTTVDALGLLIEPLVRQATAEAPIGASGVGILDSLESIEFTRGIEELHNQLDALTESPPLLPAGGGIPEESNNLQSLYQRLDRLQQSDLNESRPSKETY